MNLINEKVPSSGFIIIIIIIILFCEGESLCQFYLSKLVKYQMLVAKGKD